MSSKLIDDGLYGKRTVNACLVSISNLLCDCGSIRFSNSYCTLRIKEMGILSSNSSAGVYRFRILMIWALVNREHMVQICLTSDSLACNKCNNHAAWIIGCRVSTIQALIVSCPWISWSRSHFSRWEMCTESECLSTSDTFLYAVGGCLMRTHKCNRTPGK